MKKTIYKNKFIHLLFDSKSEYFISVFNNAKITLSDSKDIVRDRIAAFKSKDCYDSIVVINKKTKFEKGSMDYFSGEGSRFIRTIAIVDNRKRAWMYCWLINLLSLKKPGKPNTRMFLKEEKAKEWIQEELKK